MICMRFSLTPRQVQNSLLDWAVTALTYRALSEENGRTVHLDKDATREPGCKLDVPSSRWTLSYGVLPQDAVLAQLGYELAARRIVQFISFKLQEMQGSKVKLASHFLSFQKWQVGCPVEEHVSNVGVGLSREAASVT